MIYPDFSPAAPEERHRLPVSKEVGTCGVSVRFLSLFMHDRSSWRIIRLRVMHVLRRCVELGEAGIGGSTVTGEEKHVEMVLYSASDNDKASSGLSLILSNGTIPVAR